MNNNTMDVKQNIQRIIEQIDTLTKELYRLEGSLRVFREMERNGILTVDVPTEATPPPSPPIGDEVKET